MTDRKAHASRINGRRSRGPRTAEGKTRSSRNALRHGLSLSISRDSKAAFEIDRLTLLVTQAYPRLAGRDSVRAVVDAQADLTRIRSAKAALFARLLGEDNEPAPLREIVAEGTHRPDDIGAELAVEREAVPFLAEPDPVGLLLRLDRYESRAISRLIKGIRALAEDDKKVSFP